MYRELFGFSLDKVLYFLLLLVALPLAAIFRYVLHYKITSTTVRHLYLGIVGLMFSILCFGWDTLILLLLVLLSYTLFFVFPHHQIHWYMMVFTMTSLSLAHIYQMIIAFGVWSLNFTGPLMLMVQKITYVAAAYQDGGTQSVNGKVQKAKLDQDQELNKIETIPSFIEYFCYCFNFLSFLVPLFGTFVEYRDFVTGKNFTKFSENEPSGGVEAAILKTVIALYTVAIYMYFELYHDFKEQVFDDSIYFHVKIFVIFLWALSIRSRYYFAFYLAEGSCNLAGFGFSGFDTFGRPQWDLALGMDFMGCEFSTNMKELAISWNSCTAKWLRRCIYDRVQLYPTITTYIVSALWHGFYPVFYFSFLFFAFSTLAARKMRIYVRPLFQQSVIMRDIYDTVTTLTLIVCRDYGEMSFILLSWKDTLQLASIYRYVPPIVIAFVALLAPPKQRS